MSDYGIWDQLASECGHPEYRELDSCGICPRCEVVIPFVANWALVRFDLQRELTAVEDIGAEEALYVKFLEEEIGRFSS